MRLVYHPQASIPMHLIIGTNAEYQPLCFKKNDEIVGFEIDLINEIAKRIGCSYEIQDIAFDSLSSCLQLGGVHLAVAGITPTYQRSKIIFFSNPYLDRYHLFGISFKKNLSIQSLQDLQHYKLIVQNGHYFNEIIEQCHGLEVIKAASLIHALQILKKEKEALLILDELQLNNIHDTALLKKITQYRIPSLDSSIALAVSKYYPELIELIDEVLQEITEDGSIAILKEKWNLKT